MILQTFKIQPGEKFSDDMIAQLKAINDTYSRTRNFQRYTKSLRELFGISDNIQVTKESKIFMGGFIEGEASLNVSVKKQRTSRFGAYIDPEFSITQHANGFNMLYLALIIFQTGRISYKSGSNATLVFRIDSRQSLQEKVIPFFTTYVTPYGSTIKAKRLEMFKQIMVLFDQNAHQTLDGILYKILPIWDAMRMQTGQSNQTFESLKEAQQYFIDIANNKRF